MDVKILRDQADKARGEAETMRRLAAKKSEKADGLEDYGAPEKAGVERGAAEGLENSAQAREEEAKGLEVLIEQAHKRVEELNAQEVSVRKEYEDKLSAIDKERHQLLGE